MDSLTKLLDMGPFIYQLFWPEVKTRLKYWATYILLKSEDPHDSEKSTLKVKNKKLYMKQNKCKDRFNVYISFHIISYVYICENIFGQKKHNHPWSMKQTIVSQPCQCHLKLHSFDTLTSHSLLDLSSYLHHYGLNQHQCFWKPYNDWYGSR